MNAGARYTGTIHGRLPARLEEIRYYRTSDHPGWYKHRFTSSTDTFALTDGGLLIRPRGGVMGTPRLWLDNPRHGGHHRRHHRHNPYLAAYNPGVMALAKSHFSVPYAMAAVSGAGGFAITYLAYNTLFSLTALAPYRADPSYTGVAVRALGRVAVAIAGDIGLVRFFKGHNRLAYIGGATAYIGLATLLELLGYQVAIGAGQPLQNILPAALQPGGAVVAGVNAFVRPSRALSGTGAFVRPSGMGLGAGRMYQNRLTP